MKLAILAIGFALGAASVLWLIGRSMSTPDYVAQEFAPTEYDGDAWAWHAVTGE